MKNKFFKIGFGIILIMVFILMFTMNIKTHLYHDEFVYSSIYGTKEKIENFGDILLSTKNLYLTHNGRAITHFILMIVLMCNSFWRSIANSLFFVLLIYELIEFSIDKKKIDLKICLMLLIFPLLWCTIPIFRETVIWLSGSINYMWTAVVLLVYISIIEKIFKDEKELNKWKLIGFIAFSFVLASLHELTGIISISMIGLISLYLLIKNKKINKTLFYGGVSACLGFLSLILSPGSNVRKTVEIQTTDHIASFYERIATCLERLTNTIKTNNFIFFIIACFMIYCIFLFVKNKKKIFKSSNIKEVFIIIFLIISAILSYAGMVASPTFLERVTFTPYIIFLLVGFKCLNLLNLKQKGKWICSLIILSTTIFYTIKAVPYIQDTFKLLQMQYEAWESRDKEISMQVAQGKEDIYVEKFGVGTNSYLFFTDLSDSITYNHNGSMSVYYGINSIRTKEPYYLDLNIANLNDKNTNSIKVSTKESEKIAKFYLIDKELYEKVAPYKRFKNSYNGGEITLYYSMPTLENLEISFAESQKITMNRLKLYTPDNLIFEAEGKAILNYIDATNITIEEMSEKEIILNVNEDSKIKFKSI